MTSQSLRVRLLLWASGAITLALVLAGLGLATLFDRHVERRIQDELATYLQQLSGGIEFASDGSFSVAVPMADPRFDVAFSGLYWQVEDDDTSFSLHSRSLWDTRIALPVDPLEVGVIHRHILPGPGDAKLLVQERRIVFPTVEGERSLRMAVALDRTELDAARTAFAGDLVPSLGILGIVLVLAVWFQVRMGLKPLDTIRQGINLVRTGNTRRLPANQPTEVMPLVDEVNDLLEAQEAAVERARQRAGDLAHGLKTPLTILRGDAARLREKGENELAGEIEGLVETMRRHVDRELTRARLHEKGTLQGRSANLGATAAKIIRTINRTPAGDSRQWHLEVPEKLMVGIEEGDLVELLGNLVDNAAKWAHRDIVIRTIGGPGERVRLLIEDDGPGVPDEALKRLGNRGVRLDEQAPGNGLGLAIVRDILSAYGGDISFSNRKSGGLCVQLDLPEGLPATPVNR